MTTAEHPFRVAGVGWVPAVALQPGQQLVQDNGHTVTVGHVRPTGDSTTVYNFEVEDNHNYFVATGDAMVLVHNSCGDDAAEGAQLAGSGPVSGVLEVSSRAKSVGAVKNFNPGSPRDLVFDPTQRRFATGADQGIMGHDGLRTAIDSDGEGLLGGRISRGADGGLVTDEWSGHYGHNWTDAARADFVDFMGSFGLNVSHTSWG